MLNRCLSLVCLVALAQFAHAQDAKTAPPSCATPQHRQFDFWLGDWDVRNAAGKVVGRNAITSLHKGCVVFESWVGAGGVTGSSFNLYDASRKQWHQTWVDSSGSLLELDGVFTDGAMVLTSAAADNPRNRITWRVLPDARVRQLWETSPDGGTTWKTAFDGYYEKKQ
jgi:hypothetical protein